MAEADLFKERLVPVLRVAVSRERASPREGRLSEVGELGADCVVELSGPLIDVKLGLELAAGVGSAGIIDTRGHHP
ncbi:MAG TPA: hypothetical protein VIJ51_01025 [Solirubrobacteraceae bacterium]